MNTTTETKPTAAAPKKAPAKAKPATAAKPIAKPIAKPSSSKPATAAKKAQPTTDQTIAEAVKGFRVREASARAAILLRLARELGKPVPVAEVVAAVGTQGAMTGALRVLIDQGKRNKAPFVIDRAGEGEGETLTLKRTA